MTGAAVDQRPGGWPLLGLVASLLLCASCPDRGQPRAHAVGGLLVVCDQADARIFVDDRYAGTVAGLNGRPLMLREGVRRVEIRKQGYFAHYAEVRVIKGDRQRLAVRLREQPF